MNCIQYTAESFDCKDTAKNRLWPRACNGKSPVYFVNAPSLETVVKMLESGHIIQRGGTHTSLVWLDYDNDDNAQIHIDKVREELRGYRNIAVVYSSSLNPSKFHIIQELPYEIPMGQLNEECKRLRELVQKHLPMLTEFDQRCDLQDQTLFGVPTPHAGRTIFPNSVRISKVAKKDENPMDLLCPDDTALYIPLNSASLAKMRNVTCLDENGYRFDVIVPSIVPKFKKIAEGHRYTWCKSLLMRLLMRCIHLTRNCNYPVHKEDYLRTMKFLMLNNVVNPNIFDAEEGPCVISLASNAWDRWAEKPFDVLVRYFSPYFSPAEMPKRAYTSRGHIYELFKIFLQEWSAAGYVHGKYVKLPHKRYLEDMSFIYETSCAAIKKASERLGYTLTWKETPVEELPVHPEGFILIPKGKSSGSIRKYLKRHSMPFKSVNQETFEKASKEYPSLGHLVTEYSESHKDEKINLDNLVKSGQIFQIILFPPLPIHWMSKNCPLLGNLAQKSQKKVLKVSKCKKIVMSKCSKDGHSKVSAFSGAKTWYGKHNLERRDYIVRMSKRGVKMSEADKKFFRRHRDLFAGTVLEDKDGCVDGR